MHAFGFICGSQPLLSILRQGPLFTARQYKLAGLQASGHPLACLPSHYGDTKIRRVAPPQLYVLPGDPNPGLQDCVVSALSTDLCP